MKIRDRALNILKDDMSDNTLIHINKIEYLQDWIIDAMINFHKDEVKNLEKNDTIKDNCNHDWKALNQLHLKCIKCGLIITDI